MNSFRFNKYEGEYKNIILVEGDHNSRRPAFCTDSVSIFFQNTLLAGEKIEKTDLSPSAVTNIPSLEE